MLTVLATFITSSSWIKSNDVWERLSFAKKFANSSHFVKQLLTDDFYEKVSLNSY